SDGSTQDLSTTASWTSSDSTVVNIDAVGLAKGQSVGSSSITAASNGITSNAVTIAVTAAALQSITISASSSSIAKGTTVQFSSTGTFTDGTTQDLTNTATWARSIPTTVSLSASGLATGAAAGCTNINANLAARRT